MPVLDVSAWPVDNGFERFVDLFAENKADSGVLRELTDHHLKDLRIPFGLRLKLLKATSGHANEYPSFWCRRKGRSLCPPLGKPNAAWTATLLSPVCSRMIEDFETPDLKAAHALLRAVG